MGESVYGSGNVTSEHREVADFDGVVLAGFGNLNIVQSETESLVIEADDNILPLILTEVRDGTLHINMKRGMNFHEVTRITYSLTVRKLATLDLTGSGKITVFPLDGEPMQVRMSGAGRIKLHKCPVSSFTVSGAGTIDALNVDVPELDVRISGAAHIRVTGKTGRQTIDIPGAGNFSGEALHSQHAAVTVSGTGRAAVYATGTLDATINGAGIISYAGDPTLTKKVRGFGSIHRR